jgi:hypothetical protein
MVPHVPTMLDGESLLGRVCLASEIPHFALDTIAEIMDAHVVHDAAAMRRIPNLEDEVLMHRPLRCPIGPSELQLLIDREGSNR